MNSKPIIARNWPYGTKKIVTILSVERRQASGDCVIAVKHLEDPAEATILICSLASVAALYWRPIAGQQRVMEFRTGGPTGGHWAILDGLDVDRTNQQPAGAETPAQGSGII